MTSYFWIAQTLNFIGCVLSASSLWLVFWLNPRRWVNQSYVLFSLSFFIWQAGTWMTRLVVNVPSISTNPQFWLNITNVGFTSTGITLFWFIESLYPLPRRWRFFAYLYTITMSIMYLILSVQSMISSNPRLLPTGGFTYTSHPVVLRTLPFASVITLSLMGILIKHRAWKQYWAACIGVVFITASTSLSIISSTHPLYIISGGIIFALLGISFLTYEVLRQQLFNPLVGMNQRLEAEIAVRTSELQQTLAEQERVRSELAIAKSIQQRLLPTHMPVVAGVQLSATSIPALEVGGDYYTVHERDQARLIIAIGDVSGKGVPAALLMALTLRTFEMLVEQHDDQGQFLAEIDSALTPRLSQYRMNTALLSVLIDHHQRVAYVANAGAIPPFLWRNGAVQMIEAYGLPIGTELKSNYHQIMVQLQAGDRLLLVSDGIIEAMNPVGKILGFDQFETLLREYGNNSAQMLMDRVMHETDTWMGNTTPNDDRTIVVVAMD